MAFYSLSYWGGKDEPGWVVFGFFNKLFRGRFSEQWVIKTKTSKLMQKEKPYFFKRKIFLPIKIHTQSKKLRRG